MILLLAVAIGAISIPMLGGSLSRLQSLRIRWPGAIAGALGLQILIISVLPTSLPTAAARGLHLVSYALAIAFLWVNRRVPWLWLIAAGGISNVVAIGANGGVMPASKTALAAAGRLPRSGFVNSSYHPGEHLRFLGDVFDVPHGLPLANVFSVGDATIVIGTILLLHTVCGSRPMRYAPTLPWRHPAPAPAGPAEG